MKGATVAVIPGPGADTEQTISELLSQHGKDYTIRGCCLTHEDSTELKSRFPEIQCLPGIDPSHEETLGPAFADVDYAIIKALPHKPLPVVGKDEEVDQACRRAAASVTLLTAAREAGVKYVVFISDWVAEYEDECELASAPCLAGEQYLETKVPPGGPFSWTILRLGWPMTSLLEGKATVCQNNILPSPLFDAALPFVDDRDAGTAAAFLISKAGKGHREQTYEVAGPHRLSPVEVAEIFSKELDRNITAVAEPLDLKGKPGPTVEVMKFIAQRQGKQVPSAENIVQLTGVSRKLEDWVHHNRKHFVKQPEPVEADLTYQPSAHTNAISAIACSRTGFTMYSASWDQVIKVWDTSTGTVRATLEGHSDVVCSMALTSNGATLYSGSWDGTIRQWSTTQLVCVRSIKGRAGDVRALAVVPAPVPEDHDAVQIWSGGEGSTFRLWDPDCYPEGQNIAELEGHSNVVACLASAPAEQMLFSGSWDGSIRVWCTATRRCLGVMTGHTDAVCALSLSPNGEFLYSGSWDGTIREWATETQECSRIFRLNKAAGRPLALAVGPKGKTMCVGTYCGRIAGMCLRK